MRRTMLLAVLLFATAAHAQPGPPRGEGAPPGEARPQGHLFISPMGEPFRGVGGLDAWFARADANHDGKITPAEFQADALPFFRTLDANHDGKIDGFEEQAYERDLVPEITGLYGANSLARVGPGAGGPRGRRGFVSFGKPGRPPVQPREGAGRFGLLNVPQPVSGADLELDGKVTLEEWTKTAMIRFGLLDTTKAGVLTYDTLPGAKPPEPPPKKR